MAKLIYSLDGAFLGEYPIDKERLTIGRRASNDIQIDNLAVSGEHASILTIGQDSFLQDLNSTNGTLVNGQRVNKHVLQHGDVIEFGKFELRYLQQASPASAGEDFGKTMVLRPSYQKTSHAGHAKTAVPGAASALGVNDGAEAARQASQQNTTAASSTAIGSQSLASASIASLSEVKSPPQATPVSPHKTAQAGASDLLASIQVLNGPSIGKQRILSKALTTLGKPGVQVAVISKRPHGYFITHVEGQHYPLVNALSIGAQAHALHDHDVIELAGVKMEFYLVNH